MWCEVSAQGTPAHGRGACGRRGESCPSSESYYPQTLVLPHLPFPYPLRLCWLAALGCVSSGLLGSIHLHLATPTNRTLSPKGGLEGCDLKLGLELGEEERS